MESRSLALLADSLPAEPPGKVFVAIEYLIVSASFVAKTILFPDSPLHLP